MSEEYDFSNFDSFDSFDSDFSSPTPQVESPQSGGSASVAVVDDDQAVSDYLAGLFDGQVERASSLSEMVTKLGSTSWVVVLGPSCGQPSDLATVEAWGQDYPNVATVLITSELSTQLLHKALRAGVKDVLSAPIDQNMLVETVGRIADALPGAAPAPLGDGSSGPAPTFDGERGRLISVFSTKGGSGKSVAATNLGVSLAKTSSDPVVLIDGHMQFGDVAVMLKLQPPHHVMDAIAQVDELDAAMVERFMTVHEPSGLYVLPAPPEPTFADQISGEEVARLLNAVRSFAGHVIVDLPAIFNEVVLSVLEAADDIVLVAGLDIPNIKNVKIGLSTLQLLGVDKERVHLVLNRSDSKVKLDVSEVERTLGVPAVAHVPSDVLVPISVNKGSPVVLSAPKSGPARAFEQLAAVFGVGEAVEVGSQSNRRKFFG